VPLKIDRTIRASDVLTSVTVLVSILALSLLEGTQAAIMSSRAHDYETAVLGNALRRACAARRQRLAAETGATLAPIRDELFALIAAPDVERRGG
jgi:hypothetical protein